MLVTVKGEYVVVEKVQHELLENSETTYNLEVEGFHTYYVSNAEVLVHNRCNNPDGRHGGSAHRSKVNEVKADLQKKGWKVSANESRVDVGNGRYRYPDIIAKKNGVTRYYQIGKVTKSGVPIAREVRALRDLGNAGNVKTYFIRYN